MNALSLLMMFVLFAPVSAMVALNLLMYRELRYIRQPAPMALPVCESVVLAEAAMVELPAEARALQRAYELRQAA
jgi:hypothetical protein